ncbi:uncharacterized protein LOC142231979 [Haematobia irritans]|uniref:uncharacterized protein LOC142231979 n=1 Tax=Haematobia irritans TaxID=7368 RepID=UPI003F505690
MELWTKTRLRNRDKHNNLRINNTRTMTTSKAIWWTMMVGMMLLLQHCPLVQAAFEDDPCATKGKTGVCKTWDDCPIMEQLIKSREYSIREVVSCGFGTHEELICCPIIRSETKIDDTTSTEPNVETTTKQDFWLGILETLNTTTTTTTTTTTQKPDFWLDFLSSTSTTTTIKPLLIGDTRLNESSEFFDLADLLSKKSKETAKKAKDSISSRDSDTSISDLSSQSKSRRVEQWKVPNNPGNFIAQPNDRRQINGQVNWSQGQVNGGRGNNFGLDQSQNNGAQGNIGRDQGPGNVNRAPISSIWPDQQEQNNGRGQGQENPVNSIWPDQQPQRNLDRGQTNRDRNRGRDDNWSRRSGNQGAISSNIQNNRPNSQQGPWTSNRPGNKNTPQQQPNPSTTPLPDSVSDEEKLSQLIQNVFNIQPDNQNQDSIIANNKNLSSTIFPQGVSGNPQGPGNVPLQQPGEVVLPINTSPTMHPAIAEAERVNQLIQNVFQTSANQNPNEPVVLYVDNSNQAGNPNGVWVNQDIEILEPHQMGNVVMLPMLESHMGGNDLDGSASSNVFVQNYVPVPKAQEPVTSNSFNPIQKVFENLVNSGMDIVKAKADRVQSLWEQAQAPGMSQTQGQQPNSQFVRQPPVQFQQPQLGRLPSSQTQINRQPSQLKPSQSQFPFGRQPEHQQSRDQQIQFGRPQNQIPQPQIRQQPSQFQQSPQINRQPQQIQFGQEPPSQTQLGQQQMTQLPIQQPNPQLAQLQRTPSIRQPTEVLFPTGNGIAQFNQQPVQPQPPSSGHRLIFPDQTQPSRDSATFVQEPSNGSPFPNIQSPPANALDPFKPFQFRPPPEDELAFYDDDNSISVKPTPKPDILDERPAVRACHRIEKGLNASITNHILDGIPTELGEFPHMAAIGYSRIGDDDRGPYDIRCGGTLIDSRFVLTAAHCVASRDSVPSIVRMGVVNFTDPEEMLEAVEIRIKQVHIHNDYSTRKTYNDIAILELERPAPYSKFIYPACLYTDAADPKPNVRLWVTGWGTVNTKTRAFSNILLKAPLHATPLEKCNASFVDYGLTRQIDKGVIATQMCAEDDQQLKDACQGDSGGPLNLLVDESLNNYRIVGVVSSGFGCASSTPGLYTRVAAFLDFVEQIVWPNGGD